MASTSVPLPDLVRYLDDYLDVGSIADSPRAWNGLQVEACRAVDTVALAVDVCTHTIREASALGAQCLIVHHGLFWDGSAPVTGLLFERMRLLFEAGIALYSCHLPLDAHEEIGNNAVLCRVLGLPVAGRWAAPYGTPVGIIAEADETPDGLRERVEDCLEVPVRHVAGRGDRLRRIALLTGSASGLMGEAAAAGCDGLITGEVTHHDALAASEHGLHLFLAGHYATETLGLRALGEHLRARLGLRSVFVPHPTGF